MATNEEALHAWKVLVKWFHKNRKKVNVLIGAIFVSWTSFNSYLASHVESDSGRQNQEVNPVTDERMHALENKVHRNSSNIRNNTNENEYLRDDVDRNTRKLRKNEELH